MDHETSYLHDTIGTLVTDSLTQYILNHQINTVKSTVDPISYIVTYLRSHVNHKSTTIVSQQAAAALKQQDAQMATTTAQHAAQQQQRELAKQVDINAKTTALSNVFNTSHVYATYNDLFDAFIPALQAATQATTIAIGRVQTTDDSRQIRYIAADSSSKYMVDCQLDGSEGVTWQMIDGGTEGEGENTNVDENGDELTEEQIAAAKEAKPLPMQFIPNVATHSDSQKMKYFNAGSGGMLSLGSYAAVQVTVDQLLNNACVDDSIQRENELFDQLKENDEQIAAEKSAAEEAEKDDDDDTDANDDNKDDKPASEPVEQTEEERTNYKQRQINYIVSQMSRTSVTYVVCLDTLKQNRRFTADQLALVQSYCRQLRQAMRIIDLTLFLTERENRRGVLSFIDAYEGTDDDVKAEQIEKMTDKMGKTHPDASTEADVSFAFTKTYIGNKQLMSELQTYSSHTLLRGNINVVYGLLTLFNYNKSDMTNTFSEPVWQKIRVLLNDELVAKFNEYNPRSVNDAYKSITAELTALNTIVELIDVDEAKDSNVVLYELLQYVDSAIKVKQALKDELIAARDKAREEAEQKRLAEEEAAEAARLAAEEEADRIAAEQEQHGENDEEDAEDADQ